MAESATEPGEPLAEPPPAQPNSNGAPEPQNLTPEQLVAKAIAPVKKHFLRPPPTRTIQSDTLLSVNDENKRSQSSTAVVKEKKSKRQLKRERLQEKKSPLNLCPEIARTGDVSSCAYKDKCRFGHDLEAFKAQKPADLEGECPFLSYEGPCPYGLACRFSGTHRGGVSGGDVNSNAHKKSSEVNGLNKDVQKLLWKNKMKFPKADARLKSLGLLV
ncbi:hypothetical protein Pint_34821 [Pistacia integerrima]|uniref:Uncharacterized protein n=1 Tax=Pistacia integerrima TaxID=434235 RepID=A0ACC0X7D5_9ROSI|nr:hypothetical protein Pint_34821 [Pistacia integerrima]